MLKKGGIKTRLNSIVHGLPASSSKEQSIRKRVGAAPLAEAEAEAAVPFNAELRKDWLEGKMTSEAVLRLATKAAQQGAEHVGKFARKTLHAGHAQRDLMRALGWPKEAPEFVWLEVNTPRGKRSHPIVCPIRMFESLRSSNPRRFQKTIIGSRKALEEFWEGLKGHPIYEKNKRFINTNSTVGLLLHGDGAPTHKCDGLYTLSFSSATCEGSTKESCYVMTVIKKSDLSDGTLDEIFKYLVWAFNALAKGRWPPLDWNGRPYEKANQLIAEGKDNAAVVFMKGDLEFYSQVLNFPAAGSSNLFCWICGASQSIEDCNCYTADEHATWRPTVRDAAEFQRWLLTFCAFLPLLLQIETLLYEGITLDSLHIVDLCVASHVIANTFIEIMNLWPGNQAARVARLEREIKEWYSEHKCKYPVQGKLSWDRLRTSGDWPKLKAKGATTRVLSRFSLQLALRHDSGNQHDRRRTAVNQLLVRYYDLLDEEGRYLSTSAKRECSKMATIFMAVYTKLAREAVDLRIRMWKLTPKFHLWVHLLEIQIQTIGNARAFWTYRDEDLQRLMKNIAIGVHPNNLALVVLYKWLLSSFESS